MLSLVSFLSSRNSTRCEIKILERSDKIRLPFNQVFALGVPESTPEMRGQHISYHLIGMGG